MMLTMKMKMTMTVWSMVVLVKLRYTTINDI